MSIVRVDVPEPPGFNETPIGTKENVRLGSPGELAPVRLTLPVSPVLERVNVELEVPPAKNEDGVAA